MVISLSILFYLGGEIMKKFKDLVCPKCGANEPMVKANFELIATLLGDSGDSYDFKIEEDRGFQASTIYDALKLGEATVYCPFCNTKIDYESEDEKDEINDTRSSK